MIKPALLLSLIVLVGCERSVVHEAHAATSESEVVMAFDGLAGAFPVEDFAANHPSFSEYWYQGYAEISRYELVQSRYGEEHPGEAVLIYVSEDFNTETGTKHEFGDPTPSVPVLKLNAARRFYTGVYPYSILTSVFSPVTQENEPALKLAVSVQEWCGMTYQQFNRSGAGYDMQLHSYFQSEGDQTETVQGLLEDDLWVRIRHAPSTLPVGRSSVVPAAHALRLLHMETTAATADLSLTRVPTSPHGEAPSQRYTIEYPVVGRSVSIYFEEEFPHEILAWTESNQGQGETVAVRTHSTMLDYWSRHGADDDEYRRLLGLEY